MSNINNFKLKVIKEQNEIHQEMLKIKAVLLTKVTYIPQAEVMNITEHINSIIDQIIKLYDIKIESVK